MERKHLEYQSGGAPSRLLAETTLADVDEALLAAGIDFVRFNDDYRIFGDTYERCYRAITFLAETLYRNHGLNLQPQKTEVLTSEQFNARFFGHSARQRTRFTAREI